MATNEKLVVKYGDYTDDFNAYPEATLVAMLRRGVAHLRGSEAASKVLAKIEKALAGETEESKKAWEAVDSSERRAAITAFRKGHPEQIAAWDAEVQSEFTKALTEGTLGASVRGPSVDPITAIENRLLKEEVLNRLRAAKIKVPKKLSDEIEFANGARKSVLDLMDAVRATDGFAAIQKRAKAIHAEAERAIKRAGEAGLGDLLG